MSVPSNREHHYRNLRDRYTNCTYVDGNLELTWLQDENLDLSFLQHIREVTGYVLISHVDVRRIILPSLQIIRGRTLFKLTVQEDEFALLVTLSKMHNLEMPALRGKPCLLLMMVMILMMMVLRSCMIVDRMIRLHIHNVNIHEMFVWEY